MSRLRDLRELGAKFTRRNFDEIAITASLAKVAFDEHVVMEAEDQVILRAFRRARPEYADADISEIREYLQTLDEDQIEGMARNLKGITHEVQYVEMENADGDAVSADLFPETNHAGADVILHNQDTGEIVEIELKATDDASYVRDWVESHPEGQIEITDELAAKMELDSTGMSNDELTADVDEFLDKLTRDESLWSYLPLLSVASISVVLFGLYRRYQAGDITGERFFAMAAAATGWKAAKITGLIFLLSIPVLNVAVGAVLVAKMIHSGRVVISSRLSE